MEKYDLTQLQILLDSICESLKMELNRTDTIVPLDLPRRKKKEILERSVLYERRQYERGLTGSTSNDLWFPRDLIRVISLKYLTDSKIAIRTGWRK